MLCYSIDFPFNNDDKKVIRRIQPSFLDYKFSNHTTGTMQACVRIYVVHSHLRMCAALKKPSFIPKKTKKYIYIMQLFSADAIVFSKQ